MPKIIDYCIASFYPEIDDYGNIRNMADHVKVYMNHGWQPLGGILIEDGRFYQAMVLYAEESC